MAILIEGMEMPTRCAECRLSTVHSFKDRPLCDVLVEYMSYGEWEAKRLDNCPLIEVPEPHGRLIDADALCASHKEVCSRSMKFNLDLAPTIVPASEEG